jgi:hypothetical protein
MQSTLLGICTVIKKEKKKKQYGNKAHFVNVMSKLKIPTSGPFTLSSHAESLQFN